MMLSSMRKKGTRGCGRIGTIHIIQNQEAEKRRVLEKRCEFLLSKQGERSLFFSAWKNALSAGFTGRAAFASFAECNTCALRAESLYIMASAKICFAFCIKMIIALNAARNCRANAALEGDVWIITDLNFFVLLVIHEKTLCKDFEKYGSSILSLVYHRF